MTRQRVTGRASGRRHQRVSPDRAGPGSGSRGGPRRASSGTPAATARRGCRAPGRRGSGRRAARSACGASSIAAHGSPSAATRAGTVAIVSSSGWIAGSSSQRNGVDTWAPTRARTHHAPNTVLCGAFWLKSMKIRAPALLLPPLAGDQLRPAPLHLAGHADGGLARAVGVPARLDAHVDVQAAVAGRLRVAADAELVEERLDLGGGLADHLEVRARATGRGRCAARRCRRGGCARYGHGWKPRQPWLAAHSTWARSAITIARDSVPLTVATVVVSSHVRRAVGDPLLEEVRARSRRSGSAAAASAGRGRCASSRRRRRRSSSPGRASSRRARGT